MPAKTVQAALDAWRDGERLLDELPPLSPDHETLRLAIATLKASYADLASTSDATADALGRTQSVIESTRETIVAVRLRHWRRASRT